MDLVDFIFDGIDSLIEYVIKFFVRVLNFARNILQFFRDPHRLAKLKRNKNAIALTVRQKLDSGDYKVVSCLFDKKTNEVVANEYGDIQEIESESLDMQTRKNFENTDMIVLR